jgi:putative DNA primase/helicase
MPCRRATCRRFRSKAVRAAIDARKGRASKGGKRQADDQKTSGAKATEEETIEVLRILLAEAPNTLNRTDWVKLALSLRDAFGEKLRDDFMEFSLRYKGETPCTPEAAEKVWDSANTTTEIKGPGTALYLLKGAVGKARFKEIWRDVFSRTRGDRPDERDLSHDALALALGRDSFDLDARFVASFGAKGWLFWTGTRWEQDASLQHMTRARDYLRERAKSLIAWAEEVDDGEGKLIKWAKQKAETIRHKTTVAAVESLARSNPATAASADAFDTDVMLLGTPGGTVDLRTGELREARREDLITKQTTVAPAPEGTLPERWLTFLNEVFDGDKEVVEFMQRAAGYALTGLTTEHKLLFLYGTGRNGKSVLLNTLTHIWGDYATRAAAETFLSSHAEKHPTVLAKLHRARLVVGSELPPGKRWDEAVIKDLTGGDRMAARFMRGNYFDFDPQLTLMIAGNNQPSFRGVDEALRARMVLVPFTVTIPPEKRDPDLGEKLKAEAPAILRWAIEGALAWQKRGLDVPAQLAVASQEYMDSEDIVGQFLGDETVREPNGFVSTTEMHRRFEEWRSEQGLQKSWTTRALQKALAKRAGLETWRTNTSRGFKGLVLKGRPGRNAGEVAISDEVQKKALEIKGSARREPFIKTAPAAAAEPSSAPADGGATPIRRHDIREE